MRRSCAAWRERREVLATSPDPKTPIFMGVSPSARAGSMPNGHALYLGGSASEEEGRRVNCPLARDLGGERAARSSERKRQAPPGLI